MIIYRGKRTRPRGQGFVNKIINKLPFELHLPGYQYCGPGTKLAKRLARGDPGINPLDEACKEHDIAYSKNRENIDARNAADRDLAAKAWERVKAKDSSIGERAAAYAVTNAMNVKDKLGMGLKSTLQNIVRAAASSIAPNSNMASIINAALKGARKAVQDAGGPDKIALPRIVQVDTKIGGFLPFLAPLFAGLSAAGALAGGAAGIAKAIDAAENAKKQLEESQRHNKMMKAIALGKGLYLRPYKTGLGLYLRPYIGEGMKSLPDRALTDVDLLEHAKNLKIPNFRGVFMKDALPSDGPRYRESAIVNLEDSSGPGTHWVAYRKRANTVFYFDSFGDLQPPKNLMEYFGPNTKVHYNHKRYQDFGSYDCGHLCLKFLTNTLERKV